MSRILAMREVGSTPMCFRQLLENAAGIGSVYGNCSATNERCEGSRLSKQIESSGAGLCAPQITSAV